MPMNIFLRQEIDRMQRIIGTVRSTLQDLKLAIDGTIIMNEVTLTKRSDGNLCYRGDSQSRILSDILSTE